MDFKSLRVCRGATGASGGHHVIVLTCTKRSPVLGGQLFAFKSAAVAAGKELVVIRTAEFREVRPQQGGAHPLPGRIKG